MTLENMKELCLLDIAYEILKENKEPINIYELIDQSAKIKGISSDAVDELAQLYIDITLSGKFVYVGEDKWALKDGNLEFWDKDGYAFIQAEEIEEIDEEELDFTEFNLDEAEEADEEFQEEELDEELIEEKEYLDVGLQIESIDDDYDEDVDLDLDDDSLYDEDDYNEIMDDYEDMYDK